MNKTLTVYIQSWRDFTKVVKLLAGEVWMFRGQRDADWKLDSTLDRDLAKQLAERDVKFRLTQADQMRLAEQYVIGTFKKLTTQTGVFLMPRTFNGLAVNLAATLNVSVSEVNAPSKSIENISHMKFGDGRIEASLIKLIFDTSFENDAWDILDQANISPRTIYPDLTGIAKSIRYSNRFLRIGLR